MAEIKDKVMLLVQETGCDRSEAELALELCGFDLEKAVKAIPRLFQNIVVLKARIRAPHESLFGLFLVILNLKEKSILRARAVVSHNPAVFASDIGQHWFDFEARLYACRLWVGTVQELSLEIEHLLSSYFASPEGKIFYGEGVDFAGMDFEELKTALSAKLGDSVDLIAEEDVLDMGQFQEVRPHGEAAGEAAAAKRPARSQRGPGLGPGGMLELRVDFEMDEEGVAAGELSAGDLVYARITDTRDIAKYLSKLFGGHSGALEPRLEAALARGEVRPEEKPGGMLVPIEAIERDEAGQVTIRVRFSAGVCGDLTVDPAKRLQAVTRPSNMPWWKKIFGRSA